MSFAKIRFDKAEIIPAGNRITLTSLDNSEESFKNIEIYANRLVELLPYTPIEAFGYNFSVIEKLPEDKIVDLFKFSDDSLLNETFTIEKREIIRHLRGPNHNININISKKSAEEDIKFEFNFHYNFQEVKSCIGENILSHYNFIKSILKDKYKIEMDEDIDNNLEDLNV